MRKIELVCIVEDDPIHLYIAQRNIEITGLVNKILVCNNGKDAYEALLDLHAQGKPMPELIFLDLNMPIWDGWHFLEEYTQTPFTQPSDIYILTSSNSDLDLQMATKYQLEHRYLTKPLCRKALREVLERMRLKVQG